MKIGKRDLDSSLVAKIEQFDNITDTVTNNASGFISYDTSRGFFFKRVSELPYKRLYSKDELLEIYRDMTVKKENIRSANFEDMREDKNVFNYAVSSLTTSADSTLILECPETIRNVKYSDGKILAIDSLGNVVEYSEGRVVISVNVISIFKELFSFELESFDLTDINFAKEGFYISVVSKGIFLYNAETKTMEMIFAEEGIQSFIPVCDDKLFCIGKHSCVIASITSGKKIETFNNIRNAYQLPHLNSSRGRHLFVIGKALTKSSDKLVHYWKKDVSGINYNNKDNSVAPNKDSDEYTVKFVDQDDNYLYVCGTIKSKAFVWRYDLDYMHRTPKEFIYDCEDFSEMSGIICSNETCMISCGNKIYGISDNTVGMNLLLENPVTNLKLSDHKVYGIEGNKIVRLEMPEFKKREETIVYDLMTNGKPCNNIDIAVRGVDIKRIELFNNSGDQIFPFGSVHDDNCFVMKLSECNERNIRMFLTVDEKTRISGISIKTNNIFLR